MMESRRASSEIDRLRRRTIDSVYRSLALILDGIERSQNERDAALCLELCLKATCRRSGRCREARCAKR